MPWVSRAWKTSASVKPKEVAYSSEVVVTTFRLFKSEKMDSLLTHVMPVMTARSSQGFVLKVALKSVRIKAAISSQ